MSGETDLGRMLATLAPTLDTEEYVFLSLAGAGYGNRAELRPVAACAEPEGWTLVVPRGNADAGGYTYAAVFRRITLRVHSSLEAVGLTAAVAAALARRGISANVVAGYYHDHIFVPAHTATRAFETLTGLAAESAAATPQRPAS